MFSIYESLLNSCDLLVDYYLKVASISLSDTGEVLDYCIVLFATKNLLFLLRLIVWLTVQRLVCLILPVHLY